MTTPTKPAGWYKDPSGRHESRYWDSTQWTDQVADSEVNYVESPQVAARKPVAVVAGYRAVAVAPWRAALLYAATWIMGAAFLFELIVSMILYQAVRDGSPPSRTTAEWTTWLYHYDTTARGLRFTYAYPPPILWLGLLAGLLLAATLMVSAAAALTKAGTRSRWAWSSPEERARLRAALHDLRCGLPLVRRGGRIGVIVFAELAALMVAGVSAYAIVTKHGAFQNASGVAYSGDLNVAAGPWVCLIASVLLIITLLVALPSRTDRHIMVMPDGSVTVDPVAHSA